MRRLVQRISFGPRGRRVPKRNPPPLRLEELETRTVLSAAFGLSHMPVFAGGGAALHFLEGLVAAGPGKSVFAPGHAREGDDDGQGLLVRQGGPSSAPVFQVLTITLTVPGNASPSNLSDPPTSSSTAVSTQALVTGTGDQSVAAQLSPTAASPFLLPASQTIQANGTGITSTSPNGTGTNTVQPGTATPQTPPVVLLNGLLLVAGAAQRVEAPSIITLAQVNPETAPGTAVTSAQTEIPARPSTTTGLRLLLGDVSLWNIGDTKTQPGEEGLPDKSAIPDKTPPKQAEPDGMPMKPDDTNVPPAAALDDSAEEDEAAANAVSDAYFATWETQMAPEDGETQPPVAASGEEAPNWSPAALGLALGGVWSIRLTPPREDRNRRPAWPRPR